MTTTCASPDSSEREFGANQEVDGGEFGWQSFPTVIELTPAGDPHSPAELCEPAVTRSEIAAYFAEQLAPEVRTASAALARPGVFAVKCRFEGFIEDLFEALEQALATASHIDLLSMSSSNVADHAQAMRETLDGLNAGRTRVFVVPHERVLTGVVPAVDGVLTLPRFDPKSLALACQKFFELPAPPEVPNETWVGQVQPVDLLISAAVMGDPIPYVGMAVRRRLQESDCSDAPGLDSLIGLNEVREWAGAVIEDIQDALDPGVRCRWADIERAVLFIGPRGSGRTTLSRAIAREAGLNWHRASARRWAAAFESETWRPAGERRPAFEALEHDFDVARALAPAVLYIEELEFLPDELAAYLGRLIAEPESDSPLFVVGSTADGDIVAKPTLRYAHFEHAVHLPLPSSAILANALRQRLIGVPHSLTDEELMQIGRLALGGTPSDLDRHLRKANKAARRAGGRPLNFDDLAGTIMETPAPGERAKISDDEIRVTAYHEAGHAVMHYLGIRGGREIQYVTIVPRRMGGGVAMGFVARGADEDRYSMTRSEALALVRMFLGGRAAEELLSGADQVTTGSGGSQSSDLAMATSLASYMIGRCGFNASGSLVYKSAPVAEDAELCGEVSALLTQQYADTCALLKTHWHLVEGLASKLVAAQELSGDEVRETLFNASQRHEPTPA